MNRWTIALALCGFFAISFGARPASTEPSAALVNASATIPPGKEGQLIAYGRSLVVQTRKYLAPYVNVRMDCQACHLNAGTVPHGGSFLGLYTQYPQWNQRAHRFITLQDRLAECFLYSMNGRVPPYYSREMIAMTAYIAFLSRGARVTQGFEDQNLVTVKPQKPADAAAGAKLYAAKCSMCHGANGAGYAAANFPPLWGNGSFNDGAGLNTKMARFVKANMPMGSAGSLTDQQAADVSAYVLSHPRPHFDRTRLMTFPPVPASFF